MEYATDEYDTIEKLEGIMLQSPSGTMVPLSDIGNIHFEDSPQSITRLDKRYKVAITAEPVEEYKKTADADVKKFVKGWQFPYGVEQAANSMDEMMADEPVSYTHLIYVL